VNEPERRDEEEELPQVDWIEDEGVQDPAEPIAEPATGASVELHRETTRGQLARGLMALLSVTVGAILLMAGLQMADILDKGQVSIRDLGQVVLTPVVTLTGTALGFYFGAQTARGSALGAAGTWPRTREAGKIRKLYYWLW
jgi:hypothetical protein